MNVYCPNFQLIINNVFLIGTDTEITFLVTSQNYSLSISIPEGFYEGFLDYERLITSLYGFKSTPVIAQNF